MRDQPEDWRTQLARSLALAFDVMPNAAMAGQLRQVMADLEATKTPARKNSADDLARRRAERTARAAEALRASGDP